MKNRLFSTVQADSSKETIGADSLLKATSLLYLKDALQRERYEECTALIQSAKGFGATSREISEVIAKYVRKLGRGQSEASGKASRQLS